MLKTKIAVVGAGAIGRMHAELIAESEFCSLAAIVDPADTARDLATRLGTSWFADHRRMIDEARPEAIIVATPNHMHLPVALDAIASGIPAIVEKPIATTVEEGETLARSSQNSGVPILVGHHRRYNPIIREAQRTVASGALGELTTVTVLSSFFKPPEYFEPEWRRRRGAGPVLVNLIHEIDLIRFVCGEIASVQAITSNARRGFEVEDTAAIALRLVNGALATITLSDTVVSPWSWDLSSGELPSYPPPAAPVQTHFLSGTNASLALPTLDLWTYRGKKSWYAPMSRDSIAVQRANPYVEQLRHLCRVVRHEEAPLITASDGTRTLRATIAVHDAARTGQAVALVQ